MDCNNVNKRILELCKQRNWTEYKLAKETKTEKGKTIKCKNCGSTNDAHALSCVDCGTYF